MKRHAGVLQLVFVIGVVGAAVLLSSSLKPERVDRQPPPPATGLAVSTVAPEVVAFQPSLELNGVVQTRTTTNIIPQVSGRVVTVSDAFRPGAKVARGDLLFVVDPVDYELAVERTLAEIEAARSELALLEAEAAAERAVWNQQFPDREIPELRARVPQIAAAKARIRSAEAARRSAALDLDRTTIRAPFDARVLETQLDVGQVVGTNAAVGTLFALDSLEVAVTLADSEARLIGDLIGSPVTIQTGARSSAPIDGEVVRIGAALDSSTRLQTIFVAADRPEALIVGDFVDVTVEGSSLTDAYTVPTTAFTARDQVWVVEDARLQSRTLEVLGSDGDRTIVATFDSADGIVAVPPSNVRAGLEVLVEPRTSLASTGGMSSGAR
ncbi:MAG: efflux RND transporter periplasmic adaptor subunit [Pseudomonadota bacterium]